jgi:hypothetical protein
MATRKNRKIEAILADIDRIEAELAQAMAELAEEENNPGRSG